MEVLRLRIGGAEFPDLVQFSSAPEQNWQVGERQLWKYIAAADALCVKYFDSRAGHLLSRHLLQRRQLYAHALGAGDYGTALRVLESEARLEGIDQRDLGEEIERMREEIERLRRGGKLETPLDHKKVLELVLDSLRGFPEARVAVAQALREEEHNDRSRGLSPDWQAVYDDFYRGLAELLADQPEMREKVLALLPERVEGQAR